MGSGEPPVDTPADAAGEAAEGQAADEAVAPEIPENYRAEDGSADVAKLLERAAAADAIGEGVPEAPDGYDLSLPEDLDLGEGGEFAFDADNEHMKAALAVLHEANVSQDVVSKLLPAYAQALQADVASIGEAVHAELNKQVEAEMAHLGDKDAQKARVAGVETGLTEIFGNDDAAKESARAVTSDLRTFAAFEAIEKLVSKLNGADLTPQAGAPSAKSDTGSRLARFYPNQAAKRA